MNINPVKMQLIKGARPYQKIVGALLKNIMPTLWRKNESDASQKKAYHWAVCQVLDKTFKTVSGAAWRATKLFEITVCPTLSEN